MFRIVAVFPVNGLFTLTLSKNGGVIKYTFSVRDFEVSIALWGFRIMSRVSKEIKRGTKAPHAPHAPEKYLETPNDGSKERK